MRLPFYVKGTIRLPWHVATDAEVPCPECGKPCVHVQPRVNADEDRIRPTYAFRCEGYHEWAIIGKKVVPRVKTVRKKAIINWESHE